MVKFYGAHINNINVHILNRVKFHVILIQMAFFLIRKLTNPPFY